MSSDRGMTHIGARWCVRVVDSFECAAYRERARTRKAVFLVICIRKGET